MSEQSKRVSEFYDKFWADHETKGVSKPNSRHRVIFKNLKKAGLQPNSTVLEIGCGIGSLSQLVIKYVTDGFFVGADISEQTIEILKKRYPNRSKTDFVATDMTDFSYAKKFDFILFPDVLEHIPLTTHQIIFANLKNLIHPNSTILINNPDARTLEWVHKNMPKLLQIIDQPLHINYLANLAYDNGLYVERVEPYTLHSKQIEYQNIVLKPQIEMTNFAQKGKLSLILTNLKSRL